MHKFIVGVLIFLAGWSLGWYSYQHWGTGLQNSQDSIPISSNFVHPEAATYITPSGPDHGETLTLLLQRNDFDAVIEHYGSLHVQAGDVAVANARTQILAHARQLIDGHRFTLADQLLQRFLVAAYRDVEARVLLAAVYHGQQDLLAAIDQLYEAKGYAYRPVMLQRITGRIRSVVAELAQGLKQNGDHSALLALYLHLTQLEPDHAPWFMGLATSQMALDDKAAARRSLLLVSQDPDVAAQAQAMLSELSVVLTGMQDTNSWDAATAVAGIPLHRSGNHFIVEARPAHGRRIQLLIDTGASLTIFSPDVFEQRAIRYRDTGRSGVFNTANGAVEGAIYKLDSLAVGDWQVNQLEIGVLDLGSQLGVDGLLGMNFLNHFQFFIDQNESLLRLSAN